MNASDVDQQLTGLAGLGDPLRRALYRYVANRGVPISRDEAAHAAGISRPLAAYHLDKLVHDGLLEPRSSRRGGRRGPGAGRPAKHYVRADRPIELSLPARDHAALAELLAGAVEADPSGAATAALNRAAASLGADLGAEAATRAVPEGDQDQVLAAVRQTLATRGYGPYDDADGAIRPQLPLRPDRRPAPRARLRRQPRHARSPDRPPRRRPARSGRPGPSARTLLRGGAPRRLRRQAAAPSREER